MYAKISIKEFACSQGQIPKGTKNTGFRSLQSMVSGSFVTHNKSFMDKAKAWVQ
jgi:hypothetical protein